MRILMPTHYFGSHNGGIEIVAEQLFQQFARLGHEVAWIAGNSTPPRQPIGKSRPVAIKVSNILERKTGLPLPIPGPASLRTIKAEVNKADVLLLHDCLYLSNIAAFRTARRARVPTIIIQHIGAVPYGNPILNTMMRIANAFVTKSMLRRASQVVFISETTREFFSDASYQRVPQTIFNGVDTDLFRPAHSDDEKVELRKRYHLPIGNPVILFVGRFVEKKGIGILERMAPRKPNYTWAFAGWGPLDPGRWNAPNVQVFAGLKGESVAALYRACDLFVLPSVGEGFPLVIQEALASGLPVVCGAETISADPELSRFASGVPIETTNPEQTAIACAETIEKILNFEAHENQSNRRREFALGRYSWQHAAERYLQLATKLVRHQATETAAVANGNSR